MKKAYIISTGTELLLGNTPDTNSDFIALKLRNLGIKVVGKSTVGDNEDSIKYAFERGFQLADIIISTGGLGPTKDDLTKEVACSVLGCKMELIPEEVECIKEFFARRQRPMPQSNLKQAMFPPESIILKNPLGTAPGMYLSNNGKIIILLPGPPWEMKPLYQQEVEPLLLKEIKRDVEVQVLSKTVKVLGPGESQVEEMLAPLLKDNEDYTIALLAVEGEIHIRITVEGKNEEDSRTKMDDLTGNVIDIMGNNVIGFDEQTLAGSLAEKLQADGLILAIAESCTGGLVSKLITDLPGSSKYLWGSIISYSNEAKKRLLHVKDETLDKFGAVSRETAVEMVRGVIEVSGADAGIAITGIAGPGGGTDEKPVGLVYIAAAGPGFTKVKPMRFVGNREAIRVLAAKSALDLLRRNLISRR